MKKKALITGASRGIGAEAARALAQEGYDLFLVCKSSGCEIKKAAADLEKAYHIRCETALCDVSDASWVETMMKQAGEIHVLVNNAGVGYYGLHEELNPDKIKKLVRTNLEAPMILTQQLLRPLKKTAGYIIDLSSVLQDNPIHTTVLMVPQKRGLPVFHTACLTKHENTVSRS